MDNDWGWYTNPNKYYSVKLDYSTPANSIIKYIPDIECYDSHGYIYFGVYDSLFNLYFAGSTTNYDNHFFANSSETSSEVRVHFLSGSLAYT